MKLLYVTGRVTGSLEELESKTVPELDVTILSSAKEMLETLREDAISYKYVIMLDKALYLTDAMSNEEVLLELRDIVIQNDMNCLIVCTEETIKLDYLKLLKPQKSFKMSEVQSCTLRTLKNVLKSYYRVIAGNTEQPKEKAIKAPPIKIPEVKPEVKPTKTKKIKHSLLNFKRNKKKVEPIQEDVIKENIAEQVSSIKQEPLIKPEVNPQPQVEPSPEPEPLQESEVEPVQDFNPDQYDFDTSVETSNSIAEVFNEPEPEPVQEPEPEPKPEPIKKSTPKQKLKKKIHKAKKPSLNPVNFMNKQALFTGFGSDSIYSAGLALRVAKSVADTGLSVCYIDLRDNLPQSLLFTEEDEEVVTIKTNCLNSYLKSDLKSKSLVDYIQLVDGVHYLRNSPFTNLDIDMNLLSTVFLQCKSAFDFCVFEVSPTILEQFGLLSSAFDYSFMSMKCDKLNATLLGINILETTEDLVNFTKLLEEYRLCFLQDSEAYSINDFLIDLANTADEFETLKDNEIVGSFMLRDSSNLNRIPDELLFRVLRSIGDLYE